MGPGPWGGLGLNVCLGAVGWGGVVAGAVAPAVRVVGFVVLGWGSLRWGFGFARQPQVLRGLCRQ